MAKLIFKKKSVKSSLSKEATEEYPDSFFKIAFKIAKNGFAIIDGLYPIEVNEQFLRITKRSRDDIMGEPLTTYIYKDDIPLAKEESRKNRQVIYEIRYIRGDNSLAYIEIRGHPILYKGKECRLIIIRDNTAEKLNDRLFLNYLNVLDAFPEAICVHDTDGKILFANPAMTKMVDAKSTERLIGRRIKEYVLPEFHPVLWENKNKFRALEPIPKRLLTVHTIDYKRLIKVEVSALPLKWEGQTVVLALCHDTTLEEQIHKSEVERQVMEAVNERLKWEIAEHQKLEDRLKEMVEEKEWLLKEVNHRVKNNLQIITSILNLQINQLQDEKLVPVMMEFQSRFYALSSIYSSLYQSGNKEEIDISAYLKDLTNNLFISYSDPHKNISLICETDRIFLEYNQAITCGLIVNELVSNSIKYAFPNKRKGEISVNLRQTGEYMRLEVGDDGIGFKPKAKKDEQGALGLHLVESLVKQLKDGKFKSKKVSQGTSFIITFTTDYPVKKRTTQN
jgi:PAS domain S-box-containing protein